MQEKFTAGKTPGKIIQRSRKIFYPGQILTLKIWIDMLSMMAFSGIDLENQ